MLTLQIFTGILPFLSFTVRAAQLEVITPQILEPNSGSVWPIGTEQIVIWNITGLPPPSNITNLSGRIYLGYNANNSENLNTSNPLAQGFDLTDGNVTITVPDVPPRGDYFIVLGDSGNESPQFAITNGSATASLLPAAIPANATTVQTATASSV